MTCFLSVVFSLLKVCAVFSNRVLPRGPMFNHCLSRDAHGSVILRHCGMCDTAHGLLWTFSVFFRVKGVLTHSRQALHLRLTSSTQDGLHFVCFLPSSVLSVCGIYLSVYSKILCVAQADPNLGSFCFSILMLGPPHAIENEDAHGKGR